MNYLKLIILISILSLTSCSSVGREDRGGNILERGTKISNANINGKFVVLPDLCLSACTMELAIEKICVKPNSVFGFHSSSGSGNTPAWNEYMFGYYAKYPKLQKRLKQDRALDSLNYTYYSGQDLINYGVPKCIE